WGVRPPALIERIWNETASADAPTRIPLLAGPDTLDEQFDLFVGADEKEPFWLTSLKEFVAGTSDPPPDELLPAILVVLCRKFAELPPATLSPWLRLLVVYRPKLLASPWLSLAARRDALQGLYDAKSRCRRLPDEEVYALLASDLCRDASGGFDLWAIGGVLHLFSANPYQRLLRAIPVARILDAFASNPDAGIMFLGLADDSPQGRKFLIRELYAQ